MIKKKTNSFSQGIITKDDFADFPPAIQKYAEACGYIGTPHKNYLRMFYKNVNFKQKKKQTEIKD